MGLLETFGGGRAILTVFIFICMFFFLNATIYNNIKRFIVSFFTSFFVAFQLISLFSTQSFIGYQFYVHANLSGVTGLSGLFIPQLIALSIIFSGLLVLNYYSYKLFNQLIYLFSPKINLIKKRIFVLTFTILSCVAILYTANFVSDSKSLFTLFIADSEDFTEVLKRNHMGDYVTPNQIKSEAGKNIIVITLESMEKGFLSEKYAYLTPNLNKYKSDWNYYDINPNVGSGWTSGSMYTALTGFPAFFGKSSNAIFETTYDSKISSISNVLGKAGYQTTYMNGNSSHSGVAFMLNAFKFNKLIDIGSANKFGSRSEYGIRDKDLFELAKSEIKLQSQNKKHFALFISTTDTHFPNGIYDSRMESVISKKGSDLEFMVASVDYMVGNFIAFLQKNGILENTVIYILPDHLKMGDPSIFDDTGERGLYLITNAKAADINIKSSQKLFQIDLAKMILNGANVKHNLKFLTDYITGDKNQWIRENINKITAINTAGLSRLNSEKFVTPKISKNYQKYKKDTIRYIAQAGGMIDEYINTNSLEALNLSYQKGFRLFSLDISKTKDGKYVAVEDWKSWKEMSGYKGNIPTVKEFMNYKIFKKYSPLSMTEINEWFRTHPNTILVTDKINEPKLFSTAFVDPKRLMMELSTRESLVEGVMAGILSAMPTEVVISSLNWQEIIKLKIKDVVISRLSIAKNKDLLKKLKENNIKVYLDDLNEDGAITDSGIDEDYVAKYELDYAFGMFADKWILDH